MASSRFTNADIHAAFEAGKGKVIAKQVFEEVLKGFADKGLLLRQKVSQTANVFDSRNSQRHSEDIHSIFQYRLDYIGSSTAVVLYRVDGTKDLSQVAFALFNDTVGFYQPITIAKLIAFLEKTKHLETSLEDVVIHSNEALNRVLATGRSMEAK